MAYIRVNLMLINMSKFYKINLINLREFLIDNGIRVMVVDVLGKENVKL